MKIFFLSSPEFGEKSVPFLKKTFFGLHLICSPEQNRGRGLSPPVLKIWQYWGKFANYPLQCSTKIGTPAVSTNKSQFFGRYIVPNCAESLFCMCFFFWSSIDLEDKNPSTFGEGFFFGLFNRIRGWFMNLNHNFHLISFAFWMRLVKATKASPHAKLYTLNTVLVIWPVEEKCSLRC